MVHAEAVRNSFKNGAFPLFVFVSSLYQAATPHNHGSLERIVLKNLTRMFQATKFVTFLVGRSPAIPKIAIPESAIYTHN